MEILEETVPCMKLFLEVISVTIFLTVTSHLLYAFRSVPWINEYLSIIVALLLLYVPVLLMWRKGRKITFFDEGWKAYTRSLKIFLISLFIVFPPFLIAAHFWYEIVFHLKGFSFPPYPNMLNILFFQVLLVALPEEFFFRGYMQTTFNEIFKSRWRILGVNLGWSWILTAALFALAHSIVVVQWWHFAIFFPALLFGYLRERTGSITVPILFHAASNIILDFFSRGYR